MTAACTIISDKQKQLIDNLVLNVVAFNDQTRVIWTIPSNKKPLTFITKAETEKALNSLKSQQNPRKKKISETGSDTDCIGRHKVSLSEPKFGVIVVRGAVGIVRKDYSYRMS